MPFDALFLTALSEELRPRALGCRVDKVQQPARDTVILALRGRGRRRPPAADGGAESAAHPSHRRPAGKSRAAADVLYAAAQAPRRAGSSPRSRSRGWSDSST